MTLRMVVISFILLFTIVMQVRGMGGLLPEQLIGLYSIVGLSYLITLLYAVFFPILGNRPRYGYAQLAVDNLLISLIIIVSGGVESPFTILYVFTTIGASIIYLRPGGLIITLQGGLLYLLAILLPYLWPHTPWLDPEGLFRELGIAYVLYRGGLNIAATLIVWFLSSYLSESLRRMDEALTARESDLADLQTMYENIVQSISSGLVTIDLDGRVMTMNRAAEKILRRSAADCGGQAFSLFFRCPGAPGPFGREWPERETSWRCEGGIEDIPGVILGMTFSPLRDEKGNLRGIICSFQDLTQIRKLEERIKRSDRLAAIGEMAAGVAHEIRNPLASISGSIQLLKEELPGAFTENGLMDIVTRETERLNGIITDFLLFANPRPLQPAEVNPAEGLEHTFTLLRQSLPGSGDFRLEVLDETEGATITADPLMLRQAFWNLSLNAVQAMPGGGALTVRLWREAEPAGDGGGEWLMAEFSDTGTGFPQEDLGRIFSPFYSTKEDGTGLGLSIVYKIIEQHGGGIEAENRPGGGAVVRLRLPVKWPAAATGEGEAR